MKALVAAVALVFAAGATLPPAEAEAASTSQVRQGRQREMWGCTWRSGGIRTTVEIGAWTYSERWHTFAWVFDCRKRRRPHDFDVVVEVRHVVPGKPNPLVARSRRTIRVGIHGGIRWTDVRWWGERPRRFWLHGPDGLCASEHVVPDPPIVEPVRTRLVVRKRGQKERLYILSRAWLGPVCSAPEYRN